MLCYKNIFIAGIIISLFVSGCAYTTKPMLPEGIKTVYIENFRNKIDIVNAETPRKDYNVYRPGLEISVTNAVANHFLSDGSLKVVHMENADVILEGDLEDYKRQPLRYSDDEDIEMYRVNIKVKIRLRDVKNDKILFERSLVGDSNQFITGQFASTEENAIENAVEDLARRVVEVTIEYGW